MVTALVCQEQHAVVDAGRKHLTGTVEEQLNLLANALRGVHLEVQVFLPTAARDEVPNYRAWHVTIDASLREATSNSSDGNEKWQQRFGVELVTPIFDSQSDLWQNQLRVATDAVAGAVN